MLWSQFSVASKVQVSVFAQVMQYIAADLLTSANKLQCMVDL